MARSAQNDPLDKFRFQLTVLGNNQFFNNTSVNVTSLASVGVLSGGFTEVTTPRVTVNEILYRENIDGSFFKKIPGLVKYDPVVLRKGVFATGSAEFYQWYTQVNNDAGTLNSLATAITAFGIVPFQSSTFRKEVMISVLDRTGKSVKHWMLFNAFPVSYKGADDLDATAETKVIQELTLTYETFLESSVVGIPGALADIQLQIAQAAAKAAAAGVLSAGLGAISSAF